MGLVRLWEWQLVRLQCCLRGLSRPGGALEGLAFSDVGVVAVRIRFLEGGGGTPWC